MIDPDDLAGLEAELERSILVESFADFFQRGWHVHEPSTPLSWGWALEAVCAHLQALLEDWAKRQRDPSFVPRMRSLLATLPPGSAKSRVLAMLIPWAWLRWPNLRAIHLSCNPRVALRDSMIARDLIASSWFQTTFRPRWTVRQDADAKGLFLNSAGGFRSAMGFDARIVGERGDVIVVDDPHDPEEAASDVQREHVHDRWETVIGNRVNDLGASIRIGIAQRSHEDDWSARRIAEGWTHLDLPMLFEPDRACSTPLGKPDQRTVEDEPINPVRFPPEVVAAERTRVGALNWATLYQGRPAPAGGSLIKTEWLRFYRREEQADGTSARPRGCFTGPAVVLPEKHGCSAVVIAADLAMGKLTKHGDFNVIVAVGRKGSSFLLLDAWWARADFPDVQVAFRAMAKKYPMARKVVERAAAGASLVTSLRLEVPGLIDIPPQGSKEQRVQAVLAFYEAGNVHLDEHWSRLGDAVHELTLFPNARHDDFTDAMSLALAELAVMSKRAPAPSGGVYAMGGANDYDEYGNGGGIAGLWNR